MNPAEEAERLRRLADDARDRGALHLARWYGDLAAAIYDYEPDTLRRALTLGLIRVEQERR